MWNLLNVVCLLVTTGRSLAQYVCPLNWVEDDKSCFQFVYQPKKLYEQAWASCAEQGAFLVAVDSAQQNSFIIDWLFTNDPLRNNWYTSGSFRTNNGQSFYWGGDDTAVSTDRGYWLPYGWVSPGDVLMYSFQDTGNRYGWTRSTRNISRSYICEISKTEAYRVIHHHRDFEYGIEVQDPNNIEKGPKFLLHPQSVVVVSRVNYASVECRAVGNPNPTYKWFRGWDTEVEVTSTMDSRYTLTNGKLTIQNPEEEKDGGDYYCVIENKFGTIMSNPVQISFGYLSEFSNVKDAPVRALAYEGAVIECSAIAKRPAVVYNWQKESTMEYLYSSLMPYIFISANGKLYFSEVTRVDESNYYCIVTLTGLSGSVIGTTQPPSRTSLGIQMIVQDQIPKAQWGPQIQNDFIFVFPQPPLRGQDVRLECFAYGSVTNYRNSWQYNWRREGLDLPTNVKATDFNRVLIIKNARMEDQGTYTCRVTRGNSASDEKSVTLRLEAVPYFIVPLGDQHIDSGSDLMWRCDASGYPRPSYSWYKDGIPLKSMEGLQIRNNILVLHYLDQEKHGGMYQCAVTNPHGTTMSSGQLRVLSFKPTFVKSSFNKKIVGAVRGQVKIPCRPEAAPTPEISWFKDGNALNLRVSSKTSDGERVLKLVTGDLMIREISYTDAGQYSCTATNENGESSLSTYLSVTAGTAIVQSPSESTVVNINSTAFIYCEASFDPALDLVYIWMFNGYKIDSKNDPHYKLHSSASLSGLYIANAEFKHSGEYTCLAKTPLNEDRKSGILIVRGPPGEPGGVFADSTTMTSHSVRLWWFPGMNRGMPVDYYIIEGQSEFEPTEWFILVSGIPYSNTVTQVVDRGMHTTVVEGLKPGNGYRFRVKGVSKLGVGDSSLPSEYYQTLSASPVIAPDNVRGGGGSVGDLRIMWNSMKKLDYGGSGFGYTVYYRKLHPRSESLWQMRTIDDPEATKFVTTIGQNNFYLEYEAKVQGRNNFGRGPNSTTVVIFSAEDMPVGVPLNIYADGYNSTCLEVTWDPVPDTRNYMKGKVQGYQINYWSDDDDDPPYKQYIRYRGQTDNGLVIGLFADSNFWVEVQVYNSAGLGPVSEMFVQETLHPPPVLYPQEVFVYSHGPSSVFLNWRGISTGRLEATLGGYIIFVWGASDSHRSARELEVGKFPTETVVDGIEKGKVYAVRIAGNTYGGIGKKSPTLFFTLAGQVVLDPSLSELVAAAEDLHYSILIILGLSCVAINLHNLL